MTFDPSPLLSSKLLYVLTLMPWRNTKADSLRERIIEDFRCALFLLAAAAAIDDIRQQQSTTLSGFRQLGGGGRGPEYKRVQQPAVRQPEIAAAGKI